MICLPSYFRWELALIFHHCTTQVVIFSPSYSSLCIHFPEPKPTLSMSSASYGGRQGYSQMSVAKNKPSYMFLVGQLCLGSVLTSFCNLGWWDSSLWNAADLMAEGKWRGGPHACLHRFCSEVTHVTSAHTSLARAGPRPSCRQWAGNWSPLPKEGQCIFGSNHAA